jgi:hypothetical protein
MADYSDSAKGNRAVYPDRAVDAQTYTRLEPLLSPSELRNRVLFGIPLVSDIMDPITKKRQVMGDDLLRDLIVGAVNQLEADSGINLLPVQRMEGQPFDRNTFQQWGYLKTRHAPILSVDKIQVKPNDGLGLYTLPLEWLSSANFINGQINIIPIMPVGSSNFSLTPSGQGAGAAFLALLNQMAWIPQFWEVTYTTGFPDGAVPRIVNELVGCYAAKEVLSMLAATSTTSSRSLGMDGLSQSVSTPGPQRYDTRIQSLEEKRLRLLGKLRALYGKKFIVGTI